LERVEDVARVLPRVVLGGDYERDHGEPRARPDHLPVRRPGRQNLDVRHALVAERGPDLGGEVRYVGGVQPEIDVACDGAHGNGIVPRWTARCQRSPWTYAASARRQSRSGDSPSVSESRQPIGV